MQTGQYFVRMTNFKLEKIKTYSSLLFSLFTICSFNIKDDDLPVIVSVNPDTFCGLVTPVIFIHDVEFGIKEQVQQSAFSTWLTADNCNKSVIKATFPQTLIFQPLLKFRAK